MKRQPTLVVAAVLLLLTSACGGGDEAGAGATTEPTVSASASADASEAPETPEEGVRVEISITADGVDPQGARVDATVGEPITLVVTSDVSDEVHVHADPEVSIDVTPGQTVERTFTVDRPGQVAVESHESGATILQLVVQP